VSECRLILGDAMAVLPTLAEASCDALVTDPPAGIGFMGRDWDSFGVTRNRDAKATQEAYRESNPNRPGYGFSVEPTAKQRVAFVGFVASALRECLRILKPGAYGLVWALPRTSHWTATACEDAGFEIRDRVAHLFGTGFPKGKGCLKPAVEDWWLVRKPGPRVLPLGIDSCRIPGAWTTWRRKDGSICEGGEWFDRGEFGGPVDGEHPAGRWPANLVLSHADGCRPAGTRRVKGHASGATSSPTPRAKAPRGTRDGSGRRTPATRTKSPDESCYAGPDGTEEVEAWECVVGCPIAALDAQAGERGGKWGRQGKDDAPKDRNTYSGPWADGGRGQSEAFIGDAGGPSRFFATFGYFPKASRRDRGEGNGHPTVKSTALMEWLVKLVCPPGGVVLDPFAGSGSTLVAALRCGRGFVGIEKEAEYHATAARRLADARGPLFAVAEDAT
jgi:DNA modification methylase